MKGLVKRIFTDFKILVLSLLIAVVVFVVVKNPDLFQASVLLLEDKQTMQTNQRDIGYKNTSGVLDVFMSENVKDFSDITFSVTLDPNSVSTDLTKIDSQLPYEITNQSADGFSIRLTVSGLTGLDYGQSLFMVPFSGTNPYILLSEGTATLNNGDTQALAIGNLVEGKTLHQE